MLEGDISNLKGWVLAGSAVGWGDFLIPSIELAVFLFADSETRKKRIVERETRKFGDRIKQGGDMGAQHQAFIDWAMAYDTAPVTMRSRVMHEEWYNRLPCEKMKLDGALPVQDLRNHVLSGFSGAK